MSRRSVSLLRKVGQYLRKHRGASAADALQRVAHCKSDKRQQRNQAAATRAGLK